VYHAALGIAFADLESEANHGMIVEILNKEIQALPIFVVVSADYEEM
jgi:hypothetical protein